MKRIAILISGGGSNMVKLVESMTGNHPARPVLVLSNDPAQSYLYVAPRWREGRPLEHNWLNRWGSEDFSRLVDYTDAYQPGARRFDMGEYPQFVHAAMAAAALEQILEWGVDRIQASLSALTLRAADAAGAVGGTAQSPRERVGHMVGIRLAAGVPQGLGRSLAEAKVYVSLRGDSIRVAPHLYNEASDVDRFIEVLGALMGSRR